MKKSLLLFVCAIPLFQYSYAQKKATNTITNNSTKFRLSGKLADKIGQNGIAGATIQLQAGDVKRNILSGTDGSFVFENLPNAGKYNLTVTAVGYKPFKQTVMLSSSSDLGNLALEQESNNLSAVVVSTTAKPTMQMGIDRKIFNVEKNITAQGGTAVDVMKNIPSLTVDINGNVQMRNTSPQIFVDGRPTILTLDQIPADDIERVELMTNPSSKFDASSAGGIINIILKKNKRSGLNGIASIGGGTPEVLNGNLSLNARQQKVNLFVNGNLNQSGGYSKEETYRQNKSEGEVTDYFTQNSRNDRKRRFMSTRFGADYFIDDKNTVTFTQGFTEGKFRNHQTQDQQYLDKTNTLDYTGNRLSDDNFRFFRYSSRLTYDKVFDKPEHKLTADITYNGGTKNSGSFIATNQYNLDGSLHAPVNKVRNGGSGNDNQIVAQVDYTNQMTADKRIEFGGRTYFNRTTSTFGTYSVDQANNETKLPLSNNYKYDETVYAGYFNYANKFKSFKYQVGLRMETSRLDGTMIDSAKSFGYSYPSGFKDLLEAMFPSVFITKQLNESQDLQINYSKRIRRPRWWEVNPFIDINDPMNISVGNPGLAPEYTNSFELNYFTRYKGGSVTAGVYYKNNVRDITEYSDTISTQLYQQLANAGVSPNAIVNTFINAGHTNRWGGEFTVQQKILKELDLTYNLNLQYRKTDAQVGEKSLNNEGFNYNTKFIANYKIAGSRSIFNNLNFQWVAQYESPQVIPQGKRKEVFVSDFAMRKEFLKNNAAALSFSISDIFNTRKYGSIYDTDAFYQDSYGRWDIRTFRLTFSYKFGKSDFNMFKRHDDDGGGNG